MPALGGRHDWNSGDILYPLKGQSMLFKAIHRMSAEAKGGILLFVAALAAFVLSNSPWAEFYNALLNTSLKIHIAGFFTEKTLLSWINEGLMTIFFLLIGLELKRECLIGHLS